MIAQTVRTKERASGHVIRNGWKWAIWTDLQPNVSASNLFKICVNLSSESSFLKLFLHWSKSPQTPANIWRLNQLFKWESLPITTPFSTRWCHKPSNTCKCPIHCNWSQRKSSASSYLSKESNLFTWSELQMKRFSFLSPRVADPLKTFGWRCSTRSRITDTAKASCRDTPAYSPRWDQSSSTG